MRRDANLARGGIIRTRMVMHGKRQCRPQCQQQGKPRYAFRDQSHACYATMRFSNVHRNQKRMQREYLALATAEPALGVRKTATEKAGPPRGHFSKSARSGAPLSYFARCSDASPRYTPPEMWPTRQMGSRTYERKRKNREVYYQPAGAKTQ